MKSRLPLLCAIAACAGAFLVAGAWAGEETRASPRGPGPRAGPQAVSSDGRWVVDGSAAPHTVTVLDSDRRVVRTYAAAALDGRFGSAVKGVHDAPDRKSFIVTFRELPELWELSYDPDAEPIYEGLVHDYRMGEALAKPGFLGVKRTPLDAPLDVFLLDAAQRHVLGFARPAGGAQTDAGLTAEVINLDIRRRIALLPLPALPAAGLGAAFTAQGRPLLAFATDPPGPLQVIDPVPWRVAGTVTFHEGGATLRRHDTAAHPWALDAPSLAAIRRLLPHPP